MGNSLGGKKTVKIMKLSGETFKVKGPVKAGEVLKDYPSGYVLLESESVKHYGIRAKPIELNRALEAKRLYFLVELPKAPEEIKSTRRIRSGIEMNAQGRLESLKLARRSTSDLSLCKPTTSMMVDSSNCGELDTGTTRVKMMLPKAELSKLMEESRDEDEAAQKILNLCLAKSREGGGRGDAGERKRDEHAGYQAHHRVPRKRVSFRPTDEGDIQVAVAIDSMLNKEISRFH